MASKAKMRSMQRGAMKREREFVKAQDIYRNHKPKRANADEPHLAFDQFSKANTEEMLFRMNVVSIAASRNGIGSASEVAKLLNKLNFRTAVGAPWTPRLVWFLRQDLKERFATKRAEVTTAQREKDPELRKFNDQVTRHVMSRLEAIRAEFEDSKPTLGDVAPGLAALAAKMESN